MREFPNCGYKRITGLLLNLGHRILQNRIRECMRRVNPEGVLLRVLELRTVCQRRYQVSGSLALWHIDGNHKLIRWRLVIHGGIDGFLRMIVFYHAAQVTWQVLYSIAFSKQLEVFVYLQEYGLIRVGITGLQSLHRGERVLFNCESLVLSQLQIGELMISGVGVGWDGPAPDVSLDDETPVEVPNTRNPLEPASY
ncbi:unnamed protein product [Porites lobata]|uniref:Integrase core domain-containing protein n=1 Tax=Porites lobata TaxID=104759 RepID=A0ABN8Q7X5_9CNID|nr:unnamed protein product [Porites lobata]